MSFSISWQLSLRVGSDRARDRLLERFATATGLEIAHMESERDREDPALLRVIASSALSTVDLAEAVLETLCCCGKVGAWMEVNSPNAETDEGWVFDGIISRGTSISGVEWVAFHLRRVASTADGRG